MAHSGHWGRFSPPTRAALVGLPQASSRLSCRTHKGNIVSASSTFLPLVLQLKGAHTCMLSRRLEGSAELQLALKGPTRQARPLTVDEVKRLHQVTMDDSADLQSECWHVTYCSPRAAERAMCRTWGRYLITSRPRLQLRRARIHTDINEISQGSTCSGEEEPAASHLGLCNVCDRGRLALQVDFASERRLRGLPRVTCINGLSP